jgi:hypothetical protein
MLIIKYVKGHSNKITWPNAEVEENCELSLKPARLS